MLGARLVLHPANGGVIAGSVAAFEGAAGVYSSTSHAFYLHVNGGGAGYIAGPAQGGSDTNLMAVSPECVRDNPAFPRVGEPQEALFHARIRVHDAFGYLLVRSFRASEPVAAAYLSLYRSLGGRRAEAGQ